MNRGRASRLVLELTWAGYQAVGIAPTPHPYGRGEHPRDYQIARATAVLYYQALGCRLIQGPDVYEALRAQAAAAIRAGHDRVAKGLPLELLEGVAGYDMRVEALVADNGTVGLVLPVYQGLSWRSILNRLTMSRDADGDLDEDHDKRTALAQVAFVVPLWFVVIGAIPSETRAACGERSHRSTRPRNTRKGSADRVRQK